MESSSCSSERQAQSSELFICFTSRLSSSMKISSSSSSKGASSTSILSPARQISLSSSLSRRLRSSGSLKGAASPMFPAGGKKRSGGVGSSFDTPEPSSPKVTCIGQVRVKTKMQAGKNKLSKKKKKMTATTISRSRSSSSSGHQLRRTLTAGEASFRRAAAEQESDCGGVGAEARSANNRYWVHHLPVAICEALREFSCFLPCRSPCARDGDRKRPPEEAVRDGNGNGNGDGGRSCGAVFARWLVAVQDGDGKGREIELVVGDEEEVAAAAEKDVRSGSQRRRVFEGIEFKELEAMAAREEALGGGGGGGKEEAARVSLCVPPKNALLLMRCRSDPVKMAALASRFWESPAPKKVDDNVYEDEDEDEDEEEEEEEEVGVVDEKNDKCLDVEEEASSEVVEEEEVEDFKACEEDQASEQEFQECSEAVAQVEKEDIISGEDDEKEKRDLDIISQSVESMEETDSSAAAETRADRDVDVEVEEEEEAEAELVNEDEQECDSQEKEVRHKQEKEEEDTGQQNVRPESEQEQPVKPTKEENAETELKVEQEERSTEEEEEAEAARESEQKKAPKVEIRESQGLPDCLLLMMCEPKLSMEVSKETWVCTTDFIRCLPERRRSTAANNPNAAADQPSKSRRIAPKPPVAAVKNGAPSPARQAAALQPPRSSCSFPAVASVIERKLTPYEPLVLTRCKSEPMRSAAKLAAVAAAPTAQPPEASSCFWKNRKLEAHHHRPPTVGVGGAAGVGF